VILNGDGAALPKAVGYVRTGCLDQEAAALQKNLILKYAQEKGFQLVGIYEDTGLIRGALEALLEAAGNKEFSLVITDKVKNFLYQDKYRELFAQGVALYFTQPGDSLALEKKKAKGKASELKRSYLAAKQAERKIYSL